MRELFKANPPAKLKKKIYIQAGDVVQLQHRELEKYLAGAGKGYATMANSSATNIPTLWQVCHHGPYNQIDGLTTGKAAIEIFNRSNRLEGGRLKHHKESEKKLKNGVCLRNVLTGQYLTGHADVWGVNGTGNGDATKVQIQPESAAERGRLRGFGGDRAARTAKEKWQAAGRKIVALNLAKKKEKLQNDHGAKKQSEPSTMERRQEGIENDLYAEPQFLSVSGDEDEDEDEEDASSSEGSSFESSDDDSYDGFSEPASPGSPGSPGSPDGETYDGFPDMHAIANEAVANHEDKIFKKQMKLTNDSKGSGMGDMDRTAFGFVPVDAASNDNIENNGYYRIKAKNTSTVKDAFVHFPENGQPFTIDEATGESVTPPELLQGSDSFQDVFCITKVDGDFLKDVYYVQGIRPVLQQMVNLIAPETNDSSRDDKSDIASSVGEAPGRGDGPVKVKPSLSQLLKASETDNKDLSNIMLVGISLCKELTSFLSPLDADGQVNTEKAAQRRSMLRTFNILQSLVKLLHSPLAGQTGPELEAAADHLYKIEFKGQSLLQMLWQEILHVLSVVSFDHKETGQTDNGGVKEYLVNFFRLFTIHLIYFGSSRAAHMLVALAKGSRDVCDAILKDPKPGTAGDFRFFLSFLSLPEYRTPLRKTAVTFEYFNVLRAFCTQGEQAVVKVQNMIAHALQGKADLIGRTTERLALSVPLLYSFDREEAGERIELEVEPPEESQQSAVKKRVKKKGELKQESDWELKRDEEDNKFYQSKTNPAKVRMTDPPDDEFEWDTQGNITATKVQKEFIAKILIVLSEDQSGHVTLDYQKGGEGWPAHANELTVICEPINDERAVTTFEKYFEPTLKDEQRFFLLEAQMNMMAEVSRGRNVESKMLVEQHFTKEVLGKVFKDSVLCYGLRTAALQMFHNIHLNVGDIVPDGHRPQLIYRWDGKDRKNIGNEDYVESADKIHHWLVGGTSEWLQTTEALQRAGTVKRSSHAEVVTGKSFRADLEGFMKEMAHIVKEQHPWNGMNSSKRVPFHQKQGEFVVCALKVAKFLTLVRYYSRPNNEGKGHALLKVLQTCVLDYAADAVHYKTAMAEDIMRNNLINSVLTLSLELVEQLTYVKIERDAVGFFMTDYRYIYALSYEVDHHPPLEELHDTHELKSIAPKQCTESDAKEKWADTTRHPCVRLTHPEINKKKIFESADTDVDAKLENEHKKVEKYLKWLFSRGLPKEDMEGITTVLLNLARFAPASVSMKATNLIVNLQSSQQSFFKTCTDVFVVVKHETARQWDEIRKIGQQLFQLVHNSIMDETCAEEVIKHVEDLKAKLRKSETSPTGKPRSIIETDYQKLCFKEGIAHLMLSILKHDLDDDQLDNDGENDTTTVSQKMLIHCLGLLADLSHNYKPVQEIMLNEMVSLLSYKNCLGPLVAANLVNAYKPVLQNITLQAKITEVHVAALVGRMLALYDKEFYVAEFLDLLFVIAWAHEDVVDLTVVHQNQSTIITQLMKNGTIGKDMLEDTERISSWRGFESHDSARLFGKAEVGATEIKVKGEGYDERLPGVVIGEKNGDDPEKWDQELAVIEKHSYDKKTGIATLTLKEGLKKKHGDGSEVVKPSARMLELASHIKITESLHPDSKTCKVGGHRTEKHLPSGVNVIIGKGSNKELNVVKSCVKKVDDVDGGESPSYYHEVTFELPVAHFHKKGTRMIIVGAPAIKKGTLASIKLDKQYTISLVELLAICGAGKNIYIEAICKKIIPIEMESGKEEDGGLINVITKKILAMKFESGLLEEHIELPRLKAYMKYLYHIYLSDNCLVQIELRYPLITNPLIWEILDQCKGEVLAFSDAVDGDGVEEVVFENRLSLLFDVCGPFLSAVFKTHYTTENLETAKDLEDQRASMEDKGNQLSASNYLQVFNPNEEKVLTKEECEANFFNIAPKLVEGITRTIVQGRHQRWWKDKHKDMLEKLLESLLEHSVVREAKQNMGMDSLEETINNELLMEANIVDHTQSNRELLSFKDPKVAAVKLSAMLEANPAFNMYIILTQRTVGAEKDQWCLHKGDNGLVTHGDHVNMSLNTFIARLQELDSFQNRGGHHCYVKIAEGANKGMVKFAECRYLEDLEDGGLPSTNQFQQVKKIFSNSDDPRNSTQRTGVILKHLAHIRGRLAEEGNLGDDVKQKYFGEVTNMFNILAAILHDITCKLHGSEKVLTPEETAELEENHQILQKIMVEGEDGYSVLTECLQYLQVSNHQVMKAAFRVFVACLQGATDHVLSEAHKALETPVGGKALQKLRDELERGLISVRDNFMRMDRREAKKEQERQDRLIADAKAREKSEQALSNRDKIVVVQLDMIKDYMKKIRHGANGQHEVVEEADDGEEQKTSVMTGGKDTANNGDVEFNSLVYNWCFDMVSGIGKMVDGGNAGIRHAFREQKENSVNFVSVLSNSFKILPSEVTDREHRKKWLKLVGGVANALSELCEGIVENQKIAFGSDVLKHANHFMRLSHKQNYINVARMQQQMLALVGTMLESNQHRQTKHAFEMAAALDLQGVRSAMNSHYYLHFFCEHFGKTGDKDFPKEPDKLLRDNAFRCYWVLRRIEDLTAIDAALESRPGNWAEEDEMLQIETVISKDDAPETNTELAEDDDIESDMVSEQAAILHKIVKKDRELKVTIQEALADEKAKHKADEEDAKARDQTFNQAPSDEFAVFWKEVLVHFSHILDSPQKQDRLNFFATKTNSIEFIRANQLEKLYFYYDEHEKMSQIYRDRVLANLDWSSAQNKVRDFITKFDKMKGAMNVQKNLKSKWYARYIADGTAFRWQVAVMSLTYILNLMLLVAFSLDRDAIAASDKEDNSVLRKLLKADDGWFDLANTIVGIMHVIVSFGVVMQYFVNQSTGEGIKVLLTADYTASSYYVLFFAFSVAGLFSHGYFYIYHLLHIVQNNKDLQSAVNAVTYNGKSLLWVAFLTLTVVYIFSFFSFIFFRRDYINDDGMYCNSLLDCFATLIGNVDSGGIRDRIGSGVQLANSTSYNDGQIGRIVLDLMFWILIVTIMMNLVLGIIVDTFSQLREQQAFVDSEKTSKCFICSLPAYRFEKTKGGFEKHITKDHNMWMYLYYSIYLKEISTAARTDLQSYLHKEWVEQRNHAPFPIKRALVVESTEKDPGDMVQGIMNKLVTLEEANRGTQSRIGHMSSSLRDKIDEIRFGDSDRTPNASPHRKSSQRTSSLTEGSTVSSSNLNLPTSR
jgi:hypothetical protein